MAVPQVRIADINHNVDATAVLIRLAHDRGAVAVVFPELGITGYSIDDLFHQETILGAAERGVAALVSETEELKLLAAVGTPVRWRGRLYNAAAVFCGGRLLGVVPKSFIPAYREFYEKRHFAPGVDIVGEEIEYAGQRVPFGTDLLFGSAEIEDFLVHVEICEDIWVPIPPSTYGAMAGATILLNLSASNVTIGKSEYRRSLGSSQSAKCMAAYCYCASGFGESTTDLAWDGDAHIHENGRLLSESVRFSSDSQLITGDVHLDALRQDRVRMTSFTDNARAHHGHCSQFRAIECGLELPIEAHHLQREVARFPYVPHRAEDRARRCFDAYQTQVSGLATRLRAIGLSKLVIGVSGGLDSTQALLVACRVVDLLGYGRDHVLAYTMPGFATSERTLRNARALMKALGVQAGEIDIRESSMQVFRNIGHPYAQGTEQYDTTFENVQAGERTSHLFRIANMHGGIVVGTGDLSELALGWTTYGVGDQMSHYGVNVSVPKTLIQYLVRYVAESGDMGDKVAAVLADILDTEISPELVPSNEGDNADPAQRSEDLVGPFELQDFNLYYLTRYGLAPSDIVYLAEHAWADRNAGHWPEGIPAQSRREYSRQEIVAWMRVFITRFFTSQFKRSAVPNGPKVGSGGSLSPRGDWRAPSDASPTLWLEELEKNVPAE